MSLHDAALSGGLTDPAPQSARAFRAILTALSRPGLPVTLDAAQPPDGLSPAAGTVALVLLDRTTPIWLASSHDSQAIRDWLTFHTGAPLVAHDQAAFALGDWGGLAPIDRFAPGTAEYPDRSATLIVDGPRAGAPARLTGPGLPEPLVLDLPDPAQLAANAARFPLGVDLIFTTGTQAIGLPRSSRVEVL